MFFVYSSFTEWVNNKFVFLILLECHGLYQYLILLQAIYNNP